jgi:uncharacterized cupin superfamily protein
MAAYRLTLKSPGKWGALYPCEQGRDEMVAVLERDGSCSWARWSVPK